MTFMFTITPTPNISSGTIVFGLDRAKATSYLVNQFNVTALRARQILDKVEQGSYTDLMGLSYLNVRVTWE
jgi:hypothetical protein